MVKWSNPRKGVAPSPTPRCSSYQKKKPSGHPRLRSPTLLKSKAGDRSRGRPESSLFNSYYTEVKGRALLFSLDCSTLPLIHSLYCWVLRKEVSGTIFKVFGMTRSGIEPRSPGPSLNTLSTKPMSRYKLYFYLFGEILLSKNWNWLIIFRGLLLNVRIAPLSSKHRNSSF